MVVFEPELFQYLLKKYGERFSKALNSYNKAEVSNLTVDTRNGLEISSSVRGDSQNEYACYFGNDGYFCTCIDQTIRKTICKHIFIMLLKAIDTGFIKMEDVLKYLIILPLPRNK